MKISCVSSVVVAVAFSTACMGQMVSGARDNPMAGPPKVLFTQREFVKPGKGMAHVKSEAAMASAMGAAKSPLYALALSSITGEPRVVFLSGYDNMADVESTYMSMMKLSGLASKLDAMNETDGALVESENSAIWRLREDLSSKSPLNIANMRMMQLVQVELKPGYGLEFEKVVKRVVDAWGKADPSYSAAVYEMAYGHATGPVFLVLLPMKSMAFLDKIHDEHDAFVKAMGEEDVKSNREIARSAYLSSQSNLFVFSPRMSYVPDGWVKADPTFWNPKPKPMAMPMKKAPEGQ
ncbi:MAG TPA: hypothetical protein VK814_14005 [Acidobacteriaceae bacterium]|nr:hypothetical protein [Acidobacteriaceae bacterium]